MLYEAAHWLSETGTPLFIGAAVAALWQSDAQDGVEAAKTLAFTGLSVYAMKVSTGRSRPDAAASGWRGTSWRDDDHSFPSGHTAMAFAAAGLASAAFPDLKTEAYILAAAVGASRVALGRHWPTDVIAGAYLGWAMAAGDVVVPLWSWSW